MSDINIKGVSAWEYKELKKRLSSDGITLKSWFSEKVTETISAVGNISGIQELRRILELNNTPEQRGNFPVYIFTATPYEAYETAIDYEDGNIVKHYTKEEYFFLWEGDIYSMYDEVLIQETLQDGKVDKYLPEKEILYLVLDELFNNGSKTPEIKKLLINWKDYNGWLYFYFLKNQGIKIPEGMAILNWEANESPGVKNILRDKINNK